MRLGDVGRGWKRLEEDGCDWRFGVRLGVVQRGWVNFGEVG